MAPSFVLPPLCPPLNTTAFLIQDSSRKHTTTFTPPMFLGIWPLSHTKVEVYQLDYHYAQCVVFLTKRRKLLARDIWWSEEKGRLNGVRQQLYPRCMQPVSVLSLNRKTVTPKPCESCSLHPVTYRPILFRQMTCYVFMQFKASASTSDYCLCP